MPDPITDDEIKAIRTGARPLAHLITLVEKVKAEMDRKPSHSIDTDDPLLAALKDAAQSELFITGSGLAIRMTIDPAFDRDFNIIEEIAIEHLSIGRFPGTDPADAEEIAFRILGEGYAPYPSPLGNTFQFTKIIKKDRK